jgi:hypothetical protein
MYKNESYWSSASSERCEEHIPLNFSFDPSQSATPYAFSSVFCVAKTSEIIAASSNIILSFANSARAKFGLTPLGPLGFALIWPFGFAPPELLGLAVLLPLAAFFAFAPTRFLGFALFFTGCLAVLSAGFDAGFLPVAAALFAVSPPGGLVFALCAVFEFPAGCAPGLVALFVVSAMIFISLIFYFLVKIFITVRNSGNRAVFQILCGGCSQNRPAFL